MQSSTVGSGLMTGYLGSECGIDDDGNDDYDGRVVEFLEYNSSMEGVKKG